MSYLNKTGLIVCLSVSALVSACSDDDNGDTTQRDASTSTNDSGARDASTSIDGSIDGAVDATVDAAKNDATTASDAAVDAGSTEPDAGGLPTDPYYVSLMPEAELPPCTLAGNGARGDGSVSYQPTRGELDVAIVYNNLSGPVVAGHIHYGSATVASGPVVLKFKGDLSGDITQVLTAADYQAPASGPATFDAFLRELAAGNAYLNLHTANCPNGEIRAQIQ